MSKSITEQQHKPILVIFVEGDTECMNERPVASQGVFANFIFMAFFFPPYIPYEHNSKNGGAAFLFSARRIMGRPLDLNTLHLFRIRKKWSRVKPKRTVSGPFFWDTWPAFSTSRDAFIFGYFFACIRLIANRICGRN